MRRTAQSIVKRNFTFPIFVMLIGSILLPIKDAYAGGHHGGGMHGVREEHRDDVHFNHEDHRDDAHDVRRDHFYRVGTRLDTLPGGYTTIGVGGVNYYYLNGAFFRPSGSSYVVVDPPNGAIVPSLPGGYTTLSIGGIQYYEYAGVRYRPYQRDGKKVYMVVKI